MADIAQLGFAIDSRPVRDANQELERMPGAAKRAEQAAKGFGASASNAGKMAQAANDNAARSTDRLAGSYTRLRAGVMQAVAGFAAMTGATLGLTTAVRAIAGFEQSMAEVSAITRASGEELDALRGVAKELGATTEFSASQAAAGLKFLGMAGFDAQQSIAAIPAVLNLATAAGMELGSAADITSNIMSGFQIAAQNASSVADVLAAASSRANTNVSQLGQAMSTVAPIANALDISLADTAAAIGTLSDAGIQGERAGTAMRGVLAALAGPTTAAQKVLQRLGLTIAEVNPATNDLSTVLQRLQGAGLSTSDAMTIFGREAASGALVLVQAADRVREFGGELSNVSGEAQRMAETMRDNLMGDFKGLVSAVEAVMLALGEAGLTRVLRTLTQTATSAFRFLAEQMERLVYYVGTAATVFGVQYVGALVAARLATMTLAGALAFLRGALIRTGIGAAVVLAGELIYQFMNLVESAGGFGNAMALLGNVAAEVWERMQIGAQALVASLEAGWEGMKATFFYALHDMAAGFANFIGGVAAAINEVLGTNLSTSPMAGMLAGLNASGNDAMVNRNAAAGRAQELWSQTTAPLQSLQGLQKAMEDASAGAADAAGAVSRVNAALDGLSGGEGASGGAGGGSAKRAADDLDKVKAAAERVAKAMDSARESLGRGFGGILQGLVEKTMSWRDAIVQAGQALLKYLNEMNIAQGGRGLFGGGFFQGLLGAFLGFAEGGYTGNGAKHQAAGIVHKGEYVFSAAATRALGAANLDRLHRHAKGYAEGGLVDGYLPRALPAPNSNQVEPLRIELVSRFDADGGFETAVEKASRPVAQAEAAVAAGRVAKTMDASVDQRNETRELRRLRPRGAF